MTISFQIHNTEEMNLIASLLLQLKQSGVAINIVSPDFPQRPKKAINTGISKRLHGVIQLPVNFDYKSFMATELLSKHG